MSEPWSGIPTTVIHLESSRVWRSAGEREVPMVHAINTNNKCQIALGVNPGGGP